MTEPSVPVDTAITAADTNLAQVVAEAYRVFGTYGLGGELICCRCPVCMLSSQVDDLQRTPLRTISAKQLAAYTNSAHGWDDENVARQLRYFLPRYLELIAKDEAPCELGSIDIALRQLAHADWRATWPTAEVNVLDDFFPALMRLRMSQAEVRKRGTWAEVHPEVDDVLLLTITAGGCIRPVLEALWQAEDPAAIMQMSDLRYHLASRDGRRYHHNAHLEGRFDDAAFAIGDFLMEPRVTERIEQALLACDDDVIGEVLLAGHN